jgi:hypothetical protein
MRTIYGLEVSGLSEHMSQEQGVCGGLLLGLFMEFLGLLLQLLKAPLGI